jgi:hypothetical protein
MAHIPLTLFAAVDLIFITHTPDHSFWTWSQYKSPFALWLFCPLGGGLPFPISSIWADVVR